MKQALSKTTARPGSTCSAFQETAIQFVTAKPLLRGVRRGLQEGLGTGHAVPTLHPQPSRTQAHPHLAMSTLPKPRPGENSRRGHTAPGRISSVVGASCRVMKLLRSWLEPSYQWSDYADPTDANPSGLKGCQEVE